MGDRAYECVLTTHLAESDLEVEPELDSGCVGAGVSVGRADCGHADRQVLTKAVYIHGMR